MSTVKDLPKEYVFSVIQDEIKKLFNEIYKISGLTFSTEKYKVVYVKIINNSIISVYASCGWFPISSEEITHIYGETL